MRRKKTSTEKNEKPEKPEKWNSRKKYVAPPAVKTPKTPFIGNIEQSPTFLRFNPYIIRGYRINYDSFSKCSKTLFMIHNETTNVISHLIGAIIYLYMLYYVVVYLTPPTLSNQGLIQRWMAPQLDTGRLDSMLCPAENFQFTNDQKIVRINEDFLDDLFRSEQLNQWHTTYEARQKGNLIHSYMNLKSAAFEKIEHYIKNSMTVLSQQGSPCDKLDPSAFGQILQKYPDYLRERVVEFFSKLDDFKDDINDYKNFPHQEQYLSLKFQKVSELLDSIEKRTARVLKEANDTALDPKAPLFTQEELEKSVYYVPRWPLFFHLISAVVLMIASANYHQFMCISHEHLVCLLQLDLAGICCMIMGSAVPPVYYAFMCEESQFWGRLWIWQIIVFCSMATWVTFQKSENLPSWLPAVCFILAGYSTQPCCFHAAYFMKPGQIYEWALWPFIGGGQFYIIGAILNAKNIPEKYWKGGYDFFGNSHNIFHICTLAASIIHVWASFKNFHERQMFPCPETGIFD